MKKTFPLIAVTICATLCGAVHPSLLLSAQAPAVYVLEESTDTVILGGGIGGLTSAIYLGRAGVKPIVIEGMQPGGQITQSPGIQNWPGEMEIAGSELTEKARKQALESGARIISEEAVKVDFSTNPFTIILRDPYSPDQQKILHTKSVIIATGALPNKLGVPGESEYWSRGVHTCATCDGSLYKGQSVAVIGGGDAAVIEAHHLANLASNVTLILRGKTFRAIEEKRLNQLLALPNVKVIYETEVKKIIGNGEKATQLVLHPRGVDGEKIFPIDAVFLAIGSKPNTELFRGQIELDKGGYVVLKKDQCTSIQGVYAIGDVSDPHYRQAITAAGDGAKAALQTENFLAQLTDRHVIVQAKTETPKKVSNIEPQVIHINTVDQFNSEVLESDIPVIVDFYADWCGPCRNLSPRIDAWSQQFKGRVKFAKVNIDYLQKLAKRYRVSAVPTVLYFETQGVLAESCTGAQEIAQLMGQLEDRIKKATASN